MRLNEIKSYIQNGNLDSQLKRLYVDQALITSQKQRYISQLESFEKQFGSEGEISIFSAPGRSEVCGNHTDHQHGMCVAAAINLDVVAAAKLRNDSKVNVLSEGYDLITLDCKNLEKNPEEEGSTKALIRGVLAAFAEKGLKTGGFDCYITSTVISGAGLSSSAAFENAIGTILNHFYNQGKVSAVEIAKISQNAENKFFGKPCGLLDQTASSVGGLIHLDFKNPASPEVKKIDVDFSSFGYSLCIVDVKASHADLTADYAAIPEEMKAAAQFFGKEFLRDVNPEDFYKNIGKLRAKCSDRAVLRSYHFFEEEENVQNLVKKLEQKDFQGFLNIIKKSGDSSSKFLQNIYSPGMPQNQSVSIALAFSEKVLESEKGENTRKGVSRIHGGGFAGTIQSFVKNDFVQTYRKTMDSIFGEGACHVLNVRPEGSVKVI